MEHAAGPAPPPCVPNFETWNQACPTCPASLSTVTGQETLAKVARKGGVKQQLWGMQLAGPVPPGTPVLSEEGAKVGVLTSSVDLGPSGNFGLAYLKCRSKGAAVKLEGERAGDWKLGGWQAGRHCCALSGGGAEV